MQWIERSIWIVLVLAMAAGFAVYYAMAQVGWGMLGKSHWSQVVTAARIKQDLEAGDVAAAARRNDSYLKINYDAMRDMYESGRLDLREAQLETAWDLADEVDVERIQVDLSP